MIKWVYKIKSKEGDVYMKKYRCLLCGNVFTVEDGTEPACPLCGAEGDLLEEVVD